MIRLNYAFLLALVLGSGCAVFTAPAVDPPAPHGPIPTEHQLRWHEMEYYVFIHFTVNTFTDKEWGYGDEDPSIFAPSELDPKQWARVAQQAGMKGLILSAKHHDGFCLWPSPGTEHSIKHSPWKNGLGDVVRETADACLEKGLRFGVYLSPWDRNHAEYGRPAYLEYYRKQLKDLLTQYGDLFEVWFDGANGGTGYYGGAREERRIDRKTYYDWPNTFNLVRVLQPGALMFSDAGPDIRWVGNEQGFAPETCWARIRPEGFFPGIADQKRLGTGDANGTCWRPAEVDVSIRPGWFYHPDQDRQVKSLEHLLDIYYQSVGRGCNLLLNVPPDRRGLFHETDVARLLELGKVLDQTFEIDLALGRPAEASQVRGGGDPRFAADNLTDGDRATYWATDDAITSAEAVIDLGEPVPFNRIRIQEQIQLGQRIESFCIEAHLNGSWEEIARGTTMGARRILRTPLITAERVRLRIEKSQACPVISTFELYRAPDPLPANK